LQWQSFRLYVRGLSIPRALPWAVAVAARWAAVAAFQAAIPDRILLMKWPEKANRFVPIVRNPLGK
jgi:hypothetical protein